jgi:enoyl-CoA hydratase/carnithine racemase
MRCLREDDRSVWGVETLCLARRVPRAGACRQREAYRAGQDLREMRSRPGLSSYRDLFAQCACLMMQLQQLPQPVLIQVQGIAIATGCQPVSMCDLAVSADTARFAEPGL